MKTTLPSTSFGLENHISRIIALGLLGAMAMFAMCGCKTETAATTDAGLAINEAGIYTLVSVNGKTVPCMVSHEGEPVTVKSGVFTINPDGTCISRSTFAVGSYKDTHRVVKATWTLHGADLIMRWHGAGVTKGRIHGDQFSMDNEGMIFVYQK